MAILTDLLPAVSQGQRVVVRQVGRDHRTGRVTSARIRYVEGDDADLEVRIHIDGESEEMFRFFSNEEVWRRIHRDPFKDVSIFHPGELPFQIETWW